MKYRPHSNSALWTSSDIEVMRFRYRSHYSPKQYKNRDIAAHVAAIMFNSPISDDERDSRIFYEVLDNEQAEDYNETN